MLRLVEIVGSQVAGRVGIPLRKSVRVRCSCLFTNGSTFLVGFDRMACWLPRGGFALCC